MSLRSRPVRAVPPVGPPRPLRFPNVHKLAAEPLSTLLAPRRGLPILDLHMVFRHGATADPRGLQGCASLTAATLDTGTASRSQREIAERLEMLGTALQVQTSWDHSSAGLRVLSDRMRPALELLAELVSDPVFPSPEHEQRKRLRLEAILQEQDDPGVVAGKAISRAIFGDDHPYGRPLYGTRTSVAALDRDDIAAFHQTHFPAADAFLVVVGDADPEHLDNTVRDVFGGRASCAGARRTMAPEPYRTTQGIRLIDRPGAPQSEFRIGSVGAGRASDDYIALLVLNTMLGGSFTSRLNTTLREERGYTYGAFSRFAFRRSRGPFVAGAAVNGAVTHLAIADTLDVIHTMVNETAAEAEIDRARRYLALGMVHGLETNAGVAARITEVEIHGLGDGYYDGYVDRIGAVTAEQVRDVAARYLDRADLAFVVVGDEARTRKSLEGLGIGPVVTESDEG